MWSEGREGPERRTVQPPMQNDRTAGARRRPPRGERIDLADAFLVRDFSSILHCFFHLNLAIVVVWSSALRVFSSMKNYCLTPVSNK
jgi:hypothetical protein